MSDRKSSARERALGHMKKLLAAGAATGAAMAAEACDSGIVCDPLPPPLECSADGGVANLRQHVDWSASWISSTRATLHVNSYASPTELRFAADPVVTGATVVRLNRQDSQISMDLEPAASQTASVALTLDCRGIASSMGLRLDLSGPRAQGASIPVSLVEGSPDAGN